LDLSGLGSTRAARAIKFIETFLVVTSGKGARKPFKLRAWQKKIIRKVLAPGIRTAVVAIPRGNGKSSLAAALGLWALVDGPEGSNVAIVAGTAERQAKICFNTARRMVELNPLLQERVQIFQDRCSCRPITGACSPCRRTRTRSSVRTPRSRWSTSWGSWTRTCSSDAPGVRQA
jgi:phage terminase large subunit-like protein